MENFVFSFSSDCDKENFNEGFGIQECEHFCVDMDERNVLSQIRIGKRDEIRQVRALAKKIVEPMHYTSNWEPFVIQCISVMILHFMYVYVNGNSLLQKTKGPWLETIRNCFLTQFVEECRTDDEDMPIYNAETNEIEKVIRAKSFVDYLPFLISFNHVPYYGIVISYPDEEIMLTQELLKEFYPFDEDIFEAELGSHPWIFRNIMNMIDSREISTAASMAVGAIEKYIEDNDCAF